MHLTGKDELRALPISLFSRFGSFAFDGFGVPLDMRLNAFLPSGGNTSAQPIAIPAI